MIEVDAYLSKLDSDLPDQHSNGEEITNSDTKRNRHIVSRLVVGERASFS